MLSYPQSSIWKAGTGEREIKNCYLPVVQSSTTNSATCIPIAGMNRRELGISGLKLFPNVQLIKQLVVGPHPRPPGNPSPRVIVGYCGLFSAEQAVPISTRNPRTTVICGLLSVTARQSPYDLVLAVFKDQPLNFDQKDFLRFCKESYDSSCPIKPTPKISPNKLSRVITGCGYGRFTPPTGDTNKNQMLRHLNSRYLQSEHHRLQPGV